MTDLPTRLRRWCHDVDAVSASDLMDEAAAEIERLRWRVMSLESAATYVDAMLRERGNHSEKPDSSASHDAAPAARGVWDTPAKTHPTQSRNGTPAEGGVPGEGKFRETRNANEPVATLTDEERQAVRFCSELTRMGERPDLAATLRGLLERLA